MRYTALPPLVDIVQVVGVHLALLDAALIAIPFTAAQTAATIGAIVHKNPDPLSAPAALEAAKKEVPREENPVRAAKEDLQLALELVELAVAVTGGRHGRQVRGSGLTRHGRQAPTGCRNCGTSSCS